MVLLWHHSEEPFSVPDGTFFFLCAPATYFVISENKIEKKGPGTVSEFAEPCGEDEAFYHEHSNHGCTLGFVLVSLALARLPVCSLLLSP